MQIHLGYLSLRLADGIPPGQRAKLLRNLRGKWLLHFNTDQVDIDWDDAERKLRSLRDFLASPGIADAEGVPGQNYHHVDAGRPNGVRPSLTVNSSGTHRTEPDREARAIQIELEGSGCRDCFKFETRWASEPLDLLRALRKLRPTVVHFSGHGSLHFQSYEGRAQRLSAEKLAETFGAAGASVKIVVFSSCYDEAQAEALLAHIDCVVGLDSKICDEAARSFAIGFYGGLGERESVAVAYKHGRAAISLVSSKRHDDDCSQLKVRAGVDARRLVLAGYPLVPLRATPKKSHTILFLANAPAL